MSAVPPLGHDYLYMKIGAHNRIRTCNIFGLNEAHLPIVLHGLKNLNVIPGNCIQSKLVLLEKDSNFHFSTYVSCTCTPLSLFAQSRGVYNIQKKLLCELAALSCTSILTSVSELFHEHSWINNLVLMAPLKGEC